MKVGTQGQPLVHAQPQRPQFSHHRVAPRRPHRPAQANELAAIPLRLRVAQGVQTVGVAVGAPAAVHQALTHGVMAELLALGREAGAKHSVDLIGAQMIECALPGQTLKAHRQAGPLGGQAHQLHRQPRLLRIHLRAVAELVGLVLGVLIGQAQLQRGHGACAQHQTQKPEDKAQTKCGHGALPRRRTASIVRRGLAARRRLRAGCNSPATTRRPCHRRAACRCRGS